MFEAGMGRVFYQVDAQDDVLDLAPYMLQAKLPLRSSFQLGAAMAVMVAVLAQPGTARAQAVDACGTPDTSGHVTCTGADNPRADGIAYQAPVRGDAVVDLSVVLTDDFAMETPASLAAPALDLTATGTASLTLNAAPGAGIVSQGNDNPALRARSAAGDILIHGPAVTTYGDGARAIDARSLEGGTVHVIADAPVVTSGVRSRGITAISTGGDVGIATGDIRTTGDYADAIIATGDNVELLIGGDVSTQGSTAYAAYIRAHDGTAHVRVDGTVRTTGNGAKGIDAQATDGVSVTGGGSVATQGYIGTAVIARTDDGDALVDLAWVTAEGPGAGAVHAQSNTGTATIRVEQAFSMSDHFAALDAHGGEAAHVEVGEWVEAHGDQAIAIDVYSSYGIASVVASDVLAVGYGAIAIRARGHDVELELGGPIVAQGGGRADHDAAVNVTAGSSFYGRSDASAIILNDGTIESAGDGLGGLRVDSAGSVVISGDGSVFTSGAYATAVDVRALGDVVITARSIITQGDVGPGVFVRTGGNLDAALDYIETVGAYSDALAVESDEAGRISLDIGKAFTLGDYSDTVRVAAADAAVSVLLHQQPSSNSANGGALVASGDRSHGIHAVADSFTLRTAEWNFGPSFSESLIAVTGRDSHGIKVQANTVDIDVAGDVTASGSNSRAIDIIAGDLFLQVGNVTAGGDYGLRVSADEATIRVTGVITATGAGSTAVRADVAGDLDMFASTVHVTASAAGGIEADVGGALSLGFSVVEGGALGRSQTLIKAASGNGIAVKGTTIVSQGAGLAVGLQADQGDIGLDLINLTARGAGIHAITGSGVVNLSLDQGRIGELADGSGISLTGNRVGMVLNRTLIDSAAGSEQPGQGSAVYLRGLAAEDGSASIVSLTNHGVIIALNDRRRAVTIVSDGDAALVGGGTISTLGENARAVEVFAAGDAVVAQRGVETLGAMATAVLVRGVDGSQAMGGDLSIDIDNISTWGLLSAGVDAVIDGNAQIAIGNGATRGNGASVLALRAGGNVDLAVESVRVDGLASRAISVSAGGDIAATVGDVQVGFARSSGLVLDATNIDLDLTGTLSTQNSQHRVDYTAGAQLTATERVTARINALSIQGDNARSIGIYAHDADLSFGTATGIGDQVTVVRSNVANSATIHGGTLTSTGSFAVGISSTSGGSSSIAVDALSLKGLAVKGIFGGSGGAMDISVGSGNAEGDHSKLIEVNSVGSVAIRAGTLAVNGIQASAISSLTNAATSIRLEQNITSTGDQLAAAWAEPALDGRRINQAAGAVSAATRQGFTEVINEGALTTQGRLNGGILAFGHGVAITGNGQVMTGGAGATGIYAGTSSSFFGEGGGSVQVAMAAVRTSGANAIGIHARATESVQIDVGSVSTAGAIADAIVVDAVTGADIRVGQISATGRDGWGVDLKGHGSGTYAITAASVRTADGRGIYANALDGTLDIHVGELIQAADSVNNAIFAFGAEVTLDAGTVRAAGDNVSGGYLAAVQIIGNDRADVTLGNLDARGTGSTSDGGWAGVAVGSIGSASLTVTEGGSVMSASDAIALSAGQDGAVQNYGTIATTEEWGRGIIAQAVGSLDIVGGTISTHGDNAGGISALALGSLSIRADSIVTKGAGSDAIRANGVGNVSVTVGDLDVSGYGARGIAAQSSGNIAIGVTGMVAGSADQPLDDDAPVGPAGRAADPARAIIAASAQGAGAVTHNGVIITSGTREGGISVRGEKGAVVSGGGSVTTNGARATGVYAGALANRATVDIGQVRTSGSHAYGVHVRSYGIAEASVGSVSTSGNRSIGVVAEGAAHASARAGSVVTAGRNANGVVSHSYGSAYASADSIVVTGPDALGLDVASYGVGDVAAVVGTARVTHGRGVGAYARNGSATLTVGTVIQASHIGGEGVVAVGTTGVAIDFGSVSSTGRSGASGYTAAVAGGSVGGPVSIQGGQVRAAGEGRHGVLARSHTGAISVNVDHVETRGAASAVYLATAGDIALTTLRAISDGGADATIFALGADVMVQAGEIVASGDNTAAAALAALLVQADGDAEVRVGTIDASGSNRSGAVIAAEGEVALTVDAGGLVSATADAITLYSGSGASLHNDGTIMGGAGFALRAYEGAVSLENRGIIIGSLSLTEGADTISNTGLLYLTAGTDLGAGDDRVVNSGTVALAADVDFGAGTDSFINNGVLLLADSGAASRVVTAAPQSRTLINLESFTNNGLIDLRDDIAGDVLILPGSFVGTGNSALGLDVAFGAQVLADRLVIGGAATGNTTIALATTGTPQLGVGPVLVQTGAGSSADAFVLSPDGTVSGMIEHGLVFNAANGSFTLANAPSATAYRLLNLTEAAQSLWLTTADTITAQLDSMRQASANTPGLWYAAHHSGMRRHEGGSFNAFGFEQQADIGYRQNTTGGQFGFDSGGDGFGFGATVGYAKSSIAFSAGAERLDIESWNLGAYARYAGDLLFANVLVKYDFYDIDANLGASFGAAGKASSEGKGYGAQGEVGLRIAAGGLSVEPVIGLSWQHVAADTLELPLRVDFDDREGGRATAGLRLVGTQALGDGETQLRYYLRGDVVQPFAGSGITGFSTPADNVAFLDERIGTHGAGRIGLSFTQGALTGFVEGEGRFSSEYRGGGGRVGLRIGF